MFDDMSRLKPEKGVAIGLCMKHARSQILTALAGICRSWYHSLCTCPICMKERKCDTAALVFFSVALMPKNHGKQATRYTATDQGPAGGRENQKRLVSVKHGSSLASPRLSCSHVNPNTDIVNIEKNTLQQFVSKPCSPTFAGV